MPGEERRNSANGHTHNTVACDLSQNMEGFLVDIVTMATNTPSSSSSPRSHFPPLAPPTHLVGIHDNLAKVPFLEKLYICTGQGFNKRREGREWEREVDVEEGEG